MSRFIKVLSNELIKIEEYKNPRICFNNNEYDDIENYCVLRETINPFQMFYENKQLKEAKNKLEKIIIELSGENDKLLNHYLIDNKIEQIKLRTGEQLKRENYLLLHKSKAQIMNILLNTEEKIDEAIEKLKEGLKELDIRKREEVYIEQYLEETIDLLKGDKE